MSHPLRRDFQLVAGKLLKIDVAQQGPEFFCADEVDAAVVAKALNAGKISKPFLSVNVTEATEEDRRRIAIGFEIPQSSS